MANKICTILGFGFLAVGILGFFVPALLGTHLSAVHSVVHLATGAVALFLGLKGSAKSAKVFCIAFGAVYVLLGIGGFALGAVGDPTAGVPGPHDAHMLKVLPGMLELGTIDHLIHIVLGALFIIGGMATKVVPAPAPRTA
jgi:hypothetical protein